MISPQELGDLCRDMDVEEREVFCLDCGCSDNNPCPQGCYWIQPGLCSSCSGPLCFHCGMGPDSIAAMDDGLDLCACAFELEKD